MKHNIELELWKSVLDYEGLYEVSNLGRVRSWFDNHCNKRKEPLIMSGGEVSGYLQVGLCKDRKRSPFYIHVLVVESFILNRKMKDGEFCDHINTIRTDNRLDNLRVCSRNENMNNPLTRKKLSKSLKGNNRAAIPLTLRGVKDGSIYRFKSTVDASRFFNYSDVTIGTYIFYARKNNKRTIKLRGEEFYFSQAVI